MYVKTKGKRQDNQENETNRDEGQTEYKRIQRKFPVEAKFSTPTQTGSGAHPVSY
jgi:hypothetical protein